MSVAEQQTASEKVPYSPEAKLAGSCLLGAIFVLASLSLIFNNLPIVWHYLFAGTEPGTEILNPFLSGALLIIVEIAAMVGIGFLGYALDKTYSTKGLRSGSFFAALSLFLIVRITFGTGNILQRGGGFGDSINMVLTAIVALILLFLLGWLFLKPGFRSFLIGWEEQGWFHGASYKPNQGHKVRRATIAGILAVGICGIYTLVAHRVTGVAGDENTWGWWVPFTQQGRGMQRFLPLIFKTHLVVPLLLSAGMLWSAWRMVNWPTFADFLIATEAEINKVSWTTRKRLVTDTIVVLVTVFLLTGYLFVVDLLWFWVLSSGFVRVLNVDIRGETAKQQEKTHW